MAEDLLKEVLRRRGGAISAENSYGTDGAENVEGKNRVGGWLDIRPLRGPGSLIAYSELLQVDYDRPNLAFIVLIFRHVMVTVRGRNLGALFSGVQTKLTKAIQQHDPQKDPRPAPDALVVESIEFIYQRLSESVGMMQAWGK
jgi:hypothetical protein